MDNPADSDEMQETPQEPVATEPVEPDAPVVTRWYKGTKTHLSLASRATRGGTPQEDEVRDKVCKHLEEKLWTWSSFDPILPPTVFTSNDGVTIGNTDKWRDDQPVEDEKLALSVDEQNKPKRLTAEQYQQVWYTGRFNVPSVLKPKEYYTWELSHMLIFGFTNNQELLYDRLAVALAQVLVQSRLRLFSTGLCSVVRGVQQIGRGFVDLVATLVGLPEMVPKYADDTIGELAQCLEKQHLLKTMTMEDFTLTTESGEKLDLRPFFGWYESKHRDLAAVVSSVWGEVYSAWAQDRFGFEEKLCQQFKDQPPSPSLELQIANELVDEQARRFFAELVRRLKQSERSSGEMLASAVQIYFEARRMLEQQAADRAARVQAARDLALANIKANYSIRSRIAEWVERQLQKAEPKMAPPLPEALWQMQQAKLTDSAVYLAHHVQFQQGQSPAVRARLGAEEVPIGTITIRRRIWFKKNWKLMRQRKNDNTGKDHYYAVKWEDIAVSTAHPFWRFHIFAVRIYAWWSNTVRALGVNVIHGPLSFRALFSKSYRPFYDVDPDTGDLVKLKYQVETLRSRLSAIWTQVHRSRAQFEATPDRGFLGKSVSRIFNMFWNYVLVGGIGTAGVVTVQPALTIANFVISTTLTATSFAWTPVVVALHRVFQLLVYDTDHMRRGSAVMPLLAALNRISTYGVLQIAGSIFAGVVLHPALAALITSAAGVASFGRAAYDLVMYYIAIRLRARIPATDTFLCRMVHGPGAARDYMYHISTEEVLAGVQAMLEKEELALFRQLLTDAIHQPTRHRIALVNTVFNPVGLTIGAHDAYKNSDHKIAEIMRQFSQIISHRERAHPRIVGQGTLKQTHAELADTILRATAIVTAFYADHIVPLLDALHQRDRQWNSKDLKKDDWEGLSKRYMADAFGDALLEPIEATDESFKVDVKHTDVRGFIGMIEKARPHDPMGVTRPVVAAPKTPVMPTRVAVNPSWVNEITNPDPNSFADALAPSVRRRLLGTDEKDTLANRRKALLDYSEELALNPPPPPYAAVEVPRDQVPWLRSVQN